MPTEFRAWKTAPALAQSPPDVVELMLPLTVQQVAALEEAARRRDLTTGGLVRRLLVAFLAREEGEA